MLAFDIWGETGRAEERINSMTKIVDTKNIGSYTLSISDDGAVIIEAARLSEPITFNTGQALELQQWLSQQQNLLQPEISNATTTQAPAAIPVENSEAIAQRVIDDAIALTREHHPASLDIENRDRFIDQITRDPDIKPLVAQGKISRKQIMLWIEQRLGGAAPSLWNQDKNKKRGR
jgi:hypothetical protein